MIAKRIRYEFYGGVNVELINDSVYSWGELL